MELIFGWRAPAPPLELLWIGPKSKTLIANQQNPAEPVAGIIVPAGDSVTSITVFAAVAIGGQRACSVNSSGQGVYFSETFPDVAGVSKSAASQGAALQVQFTGLMTDPSWSWIPGSIIFAGLNGTLTQMAPETGFVTVVAKAVTSTMIIINSEPPIKTI